MLEEAAGWLRVNPTGVLGSESAAASDANGQSCM